MMVSLMDGKKVVCLATVYCDEPFLYVLIPAGDQRITRTGEQSKQPNKHGVAHISQIAQVGWLSKILAAQS